MSGALHPQFHPAGFDGALRIALEDIRIGRWRTTSELLGHCPTWGVRTSRSQVLAAAAAQGDAVEAWLQEEPSADAAMMRARVMVQRALTAFRAGRRDVALLADRARAACWEAARYYPDDPVPWVCLLMLAQLDWPDEGQRRYEHHRPSPEYGLMLPSGPWGLLDRADQRDPGNREAWHRMIQALQAYGENVFDVVRWVSNWAPKGSPLLLLPLYVHAAHYARQRALGKLTSLYWITDPTSYYTTRALERWFKYADQDSWSALDLSHVAQALFSSGRYAEAAQVFEAIGPFVTPEPWTHVAEAPEKWLEQFERARDRCLPTAARGPLHAARRR
jgi:tetratricopeptide (TPR) repeat protein